MNEATSNIEQPESGSVPPRRDAVSERKREANRRNAQRSTGPRTEAGKLVSRGNRVTHGVLAKEVLRQGDGKLFKTLLGDLYAERRPEGFRQACLVEQIARGHLRMAQAARYETGARRLAADMLIATENETARAQFDAGMMVPGAPRYALVKGTVVGRECVVGFFECLYAEAQESGCLSDVSREKLVEHFGPETPFVQECLRCDAQIRATPAQGPAGSGPSPLEAPKAALLRCLYIQRLMAAEELRRLRKKERREQDTRRRLLALPTDGDMGKLHRYESATLSDIAQAEHELERLQSLPKGDRIPGPPTADGQASS
jgi:hypothetical protein